jgi:hypothetical protein
LRSEGPGTGDGPLGEAVDSPGEDVCWRAGVVQGSLVGGLLEEAFGGVACGFGAGEGGGECPPAGVVEDLFGVRRHVCAYVLDMAFDRVGRRCALSQDGQGCCCGLLIGVLQMGQGLAGGRHLLVVTSEVVPAGGGHDDEDGCVEEHREAGAVWGCGFAEHGADSAA